MTPPPPPVSLPVDTDSAALPRGGVGKPAVGWGGGGVVVAVVRKDLPCHVAGVAPVPCPAPAARAVPDGARAKNVPR